MADGTCVKEEYENQGIYMILLLLDFGKSVKLEV